ncbi:ABC transporter ATP-binding protein [Metaclostridioides mangenotii]|uniref:ABC transporter ATP-binding protein n=1 Tax=Metaclostridioides mangenotii TaxID=1540 RepID=UPI0028F14ED8|nr:ABC transporter ATP-binding protein [Clostridioides mangenotii]
MKSIVTKDLSISYGENLIVDNLSIEIPKGEITVIIGPNGCGKSTTLKTIARMLKPTNGNIYLLGNDIEKIPTKEIAKQMSILPQTPKAPEGLTVTELVAYGRFPHQKGFGKLLKEDKDIIDWSIKATNVEEFKDKQIGSLSGGQTQRVWIAMALAQQSELILLDEPTTYLDLAHQLEILELLQKLNQEQQRTIVMVLHDLNLSSRFADYMIAVRSGNVVCSGTPFEVMTKENLKSVFNIDAEIILDPRTSKPLCMTYDLIK